MANWLARTLLLSSQYANDYLMRIMEFPLISNYIPVYDRPERLQQELNDFRNRFEANFPNYICRKYEEKRNLYIRLVRVQSALNELKSDKSSKPDKIGSELNSVYHEIQSLENINKILLPKYL